MKLIGTIFATGVLLVILGGSALAQYSGEPASFSQFLANHPDIHKQLTEKPYLATNSDYLRAHPELNMYLGRHPGVQSQFNNPRWVFSQWDQRHLWQNRNTWYGDQQAGWYDHDWDDRPHYDADEHYEHHHHHDNGWHAGEYHHDHDHDRVHGDYDHHGDPDHN